MRVSARLPYLFGGLLGLGAICSSCGAVVAFDQEEYLLLPGQIVALDVRIEATDAERGDLFSYGVRLVPSATDAVEVIAIEVPLALDNTGISPRGATIDTAVDVIGVKGNIDIFADPLVPYEGGLLATFKLRFDTPGAYDLQLDFFRTLGANEQIFLAGDGTVLDEMITFGTAAVRVVGHDEIAPHLHVARGGAGEDPIEIRFATISGISYTLQSSTDLLDWSDLITHEGDGEEFLFRDVERSGTAKNFYRVRAVITGA